MAQNCITEYLQPSSKMEKIVLRLDLKIVREKPNTEENLCECDGGSSSHQTDGNCAVDGILHPNTRGSIMKVTECPALIEGLRQTTRWSGGRPIRRAACMDTFPSEITIYYYKSNILEQLEKRAPVLLNISDSNEFLKCTFSSNKAVLTSESLEKEKLNLIYKNDATTWPFVFFLSMTKDNCRRFESAECSGWFIRTESDSMCMDEHTDKDQEKFLFIIKSFPNATKSK